MYSIRSPKWACLVLLTGLCKTFAGALPDDFWFPDDSQLLAVAPGESDLFTDYSPIEVQADPYADIGSYDPYAEVGSYDPYASFDGSDPFNSGFEIAAATECYYGEVLGDVVHTAPSCPEYAPHPGCSFGEQAVAFRGNAARLCAAAKQLCCEVITGATTLGKCNRVAQQAGWLENLSDFGQGVGEFFQEGVFPLIFGPSSPSVPIVEKRQEGFCRAPDWDLISK
jgi:hypothetical protein